MNQQQPQKQQKYSSPSPQNNFSPNIENPYVKPQNQNQMNVPVQSKGTQQLSPNINNNKTPPKSSGSEEKKGHRQNIFSGSKPNISAEFFGNDIAGFIKREFIRQADILSVIGAKI